VALVEARVCWRRQAVVEGEGAERIIEVEGKALVWVAAVGLGGRDGQAEWKRGLLEEVAQVEEESLLGIHEL
jgi:hypothetical protein